MEPLTTGEAAKRLQIAKSTLKDWLEVLPISTVTDSRGRRRLDLEALAVLETVKDLRGKNCGYQTIRRRIVSLEIEPPERAGQQPVNGWGEPDKGRMAADSEPKQIEVDALISQVIAAIRTETEQSEKYARAAHQIGKLESENEYLRAQLAERDAQLIDAKKKMELLEAPKPRPWWRIWS